ncbi:AraC-like ligand-binding domain-containing protein [Leucobacter sp.]
MGTSFDEDTALVGRARSRETTTSFADGFRQWRSIMQDRFVPLQITGNESDEAFRGRVVSRAFGDVHVSLVASGAHSARRMPESIRPDDARYIKLSLQLGGTSIYTQDGRSADIGPGDLVIYDTSRPYAMDADGEVESFVVMMPPSALSLSRSNVDLLSARRLAPTTMVGECAEPFMRQFVRRFEYLSTEDGGRLIRAFLGLVDAVLHAELSSLTAEISDFDRIRNYIEHHLDDEHLTPARIAQDNFISLRSLQYLFQDHGTSVSQFLRGERLDRCSLDLASPAFQEETVAQIASRHGFQTPASFSRLFKQTFGMTPGEWRARAFAADGPSAGPPAALG